MFRDVVLVIDYCCNVDISFLVISIEGRPLANVCIFVGDLLAEMLCNVCITLSAFFVKEYFPVRIF